MNFEQTSDQERNILQRRARELSKGQEKTISEREEGFLVVKFMLGKEVYGIETRFIREVLPLKDLTVIPGTPELIMGAINVRGEIFPVVDAKRLFNLPRSGITEFNKIILLDYQSIRFGLVADAIPGTAFIPLTTLKSAPYALAGIGTEFILGIASDGVIVLQGEELIKSQQIIVDQ